MRFVFVSRDVGNGNTLKPVAAALERLSHQVITFFGEGQPFPNGTKDQIDRVIGGADWLVVSLSSSEERVAMERYAMEVAIANNVKIAVVGDIYGSLQRLQWCGSCGQHASLLTVISEEELKQAHGDRRVICAPNPSWNTFFERTMSREEIRSTLKVAPQSHLILVIGNKERDRNELLLRDVIRAQDGIEDVTCVVTTHPGADHAMGDIDLGGNNTVPPGFSFVPRNGLRSNTIMAGADLVVTSGGSTMTVMAACQRVPVIDLMHQVDWKLWHSLSGLHEWPPMQIGVSVLAANDFYLSACIRELIDINSSEYERMAKAQKKHFPYTVFKGGTEIIVNALLGA